MARAQRRNTAWDDTRIASDVANGSTANVEIASDVGDAEKRGCTLIRTILSLWIHASTPGAVSGSQIVFLGMQLASDDAFTGGALPDVEVGADFPMAGWIWRESVFITDETLAAGGSIQPIALWRDIRSQRKLDRSTVMLSIHSAPTEGTAFNIRVVGLMRLLYKLP